KLPAVLVTGSWSDFKCEQDRFPAPGNVLFLKKGEYEVTRVFPLFGEYPKNADGHQLYPIR
ncbi:hypothetical protein, partial [Glutamicibacter sp.]|uniref:hypothetical protein n=1 Tax=Glutamicibacter sp. TaxID=1931995 RepID=UPI002FE1E70D